MADYEVSFICKRTVVSTKPVQPGKFIPLSVLDRLNNENNHLRLVFYYSFPARRAGGELTEMLRESISEMLSSFPIATGRLLRTSEGQWTIKCNDAGVRMVEAKVMKGSVDEWLQNVDGEKELKLVHWEDMFHKPYFWSTFYVQITEFEGCGLAIGLSCTHLLCDPICATMMIKAWADTTLTGKILSPPLFHPLPSRKPRKETTTKKQSSIIHHYKSSSLEKNPSPKSYNHTKTITTITFQFNQEMVRNCISMAKSEQDRGPGPTPFQALAGLFWTCISRAKGNNKRGLVNMSICLDMRKALGLDQGFFGNCMVYNKVVQLHGDNYDHGNEEVSNAADLIKETVSKMDGDDVVDLIEWLESENIDRPLMINGCDDLICVDLENVDSYSAVFEENVVPVRVSYYIGPGYGAGQILVLPAPDGGDGPDCRVVAVTLPEDEAEKLLEDSLIQQLGPIVLMGLNKKVF